MAGFYNDFKYVDYIGNAAFNAQFVSGLNIVNAPINTVIVKNDGMQYIRNAKGAWVRMGVQSQAPDLGSTYLKVTGGVVTGNVTVNGTLSVTDLVETSSIRFKENVQPLQNAFEKLSQLQGVSYDWKENGKEDIGFIAEEVEKVLPQIVEKNEEGVVEGMNYGRLTALLVEVVKSQQAQIDELKQLIK